MRRTWGSPLLGGGGGGSRLRCSWGKGKGFGDPAESSALPGVKSPRGNEIATWERYERELGRGSADGSMLQCLTLPY